MQFVIIIDFIRRKTEIVTSLRIAYFDMTKQELNILLQNRLTIINKLILPVTCTSITLARCVCVSFIQSIGINY